MSLLRNYTYNIMIVFMNIIFPVLLFPYASRVLTPLNFGKYSFASSVSSYFLMLSTFGVASYGVREISKLKLESKEKLEDGFSEIFLITLFTSFISFILFNMTVIFFNGLRKEFLLFQIFAIQILTGFMNLDYFFIAIEEHKRRAIRICIIRILSLIFLYKFVKSSEDYIIFAMIIIFPEIIARGIDLISIKKYFKFNSIKFKIHFKPMVIIVCYQISTIIYLNLDSTMIGILRSIKEVGYYSVALKMTKIIIPLITSLGIVLTPNIIRNIKENDELTLFKNMDLYLNFILFISLPSIGLLFLLSRQIIVLFSGNSYLPGIDAMIIMLPIILFVSLSGFSAGQILIPTGNEKQVLKVSLVGLIINVVLNMILIKKIGINGAAIATLISEFTVCFLRLIAVKRIYRDYRFFQKNRFIYLFSTLISFFIVIYIKKNIKFLNLYVEIICLAFLYGIIYIFLLYLAKEKTIIQLLKERRLKE